MNELSRQHLRQRKFVFNVIVVTLFLVLFYGFFNIQVAGREKYYEIALDNSVRQLVQYPVRGTIRDRNGEILVDNRPSFDVSIILKDAGNRTRTVIGNMQFYMPQTRVTHNRQVSSIVMFDNSGRFLWSAPGGIRTDLSR